ncbi:cation diffusion facilitator family transporter [Natrarchaeobaculum sulfurireducens]|uniref:Uncharacterized protein n=1 Tax=Natrarchaeobaculum sulfurireducens TaxID=2044521 RepID=A0A346PTR7_9EURY|nr:hypothetical protein [Natrarchaeobaculum sulfurireducens]AXR77122.1 hypothetical protein AArc1_0780 [Natrarchaeobaculum sulfurireducens]AXR82912.1 hypothetical protein AArcMg_2923 [Natrarchaeobaculum sulfurireducens]
MGEKPGRFKPDKIETLFVLIGAVLLFLTAFQSLDDPVSRQGIALIVGTFGVFLLFVWGMYALRINPLTAPDLWLGVSLLLILGIVVGAVVYATWPVDREFVTGFGLLAVIGVVVALVYIVRAMLNRHRESET